MTEQTLINKALLEFSKKGYTLFRNDTGAAYTGKRCKLSNGMTGLTAIRMVKYGLCVGSSDLIGWNPKGQFTGVEIKTPNDRLSDDQRQFLSVIPEAWIYTVEGAERL